MPLYQIKSLSFTRCLCRAMPHISGFADSHHCHYHPDIGNKKNNAKKQVL